MGIKSFLSKPLASYVASQQQKWAAKPGKTQEKWLHKIVEGAKNTAFGKDHNFDKIKTYDDFKKYVPIRDYEDLKPYVERILEGESDVLWKGKVHSNLKG